MADNYNKKPLANLETWLDVFMRMQYFARIRIYLDVIPTNLLNENYLYNGLLQDLTYTDMLELSEYKLELMYEKCGILVFVGGRDKANE
jgi:poly(A) polymerase Pap1